MEIKDDYIQLIKKSISLNLALLPFLQEEIVSNNI